MAHNTNVFGQHSNGFSTSGQSGLNRQSSMHSNNFFGEANVQGNENDLGTDSSSTFLTSLLQPSPQMLAQNSIVSGSTSPSAHQQCQQQQQQQQQQQLPISSLMVSQNAFSPGSTLSSPQLQQLLLHFLQQGRQQQQQQQQMSSSVDNHSTLPSGSGSPLQQMHQQQQQQKQQQQEQQQQRRQMLSSKNNPNSLSFDSNIQQASTTPNSFAFLQQLQHSNSLSSDQVQNQNQLQRSQSQHQMSQHQQQFQLKVPVSRSTSQNSNPEPPRVGDGMIFTDRLQLFQRCYDECDPERKDRIANWKSITKEKTITLKEIFDDKKEKLEEEVFGRKNN